MNWIILIIAGLFEVGFTFCQAKAKTAQGQQFYIWLTGFLISLSISMVLLYLSTKSLPIGTAYAVWTGIGAVGTAIMGMVLFNEPSDFWRVFFISILIISILGLKLVSH